MRALRENPDDTVAAIRVIGALAGNSSARSFRRFRRSPQGQLILREKRDLYALLSDSARLLAMPTGSFGRTLGDWFERENINTQGLAQASETARSRSDRELSQEQEMYFSLLRNLHDVFHVLTGYDRDLRGESAVLAFTIAQNYNRGIAYLVFNALRAEGWNSRGGRLIRQAFRRGRHAKPLALQNWEELFERPIGEVRDQLGVGDPPVYEQLRSAGAPVLSV
jgi:ubiquinone biosynthesis protein COQ4